MKRLLKLVLAVALCLCCTVPFAGCSDGWEEVQSITYTTGDGTVTLTSKYYWNYNVEAIDLNEYESATEEQRSGPSLRGTIDVEKENILSDPSKYIGKTFYYYYVDYYYFSKHTLTDYTVEYVKIKLLKDNSIEIFFDDITIKVLPTSYTITYFNN